MIVNINFGRSRQEIIFVDPLHYDPDFQIFGNTIFFEGIFGATSGNVITKNYIFRNKFAPFYFGAAYLGGRSRNTAMFPRAVLGKINYPFLFRIKNKFGGIKKQWFYYTDLENCFKNIEFELIPQGSGAGKVEFSYLDVPVDQEDIFEVYYDNELLYIGFFENDVDISNPVSNISPFSKRLKECLYTCNFETTKTRLEILQDIINSNYSETGISFDASKIDMGDTDSLDAFQKNAETIGSIIDELIKSCENRYWGVDNNKVFFVSKIVKSSYSQILWNTDNALYKSLKLNNENIEIKATEYEVWQDDIYLGNVGNEGNTTYPPLDEVKAMRKIVGKFEAPSDISTDNALQFAYFTLKDDLTKRQSFDIEEIDVRRYRPKVQDYILVEDSWKHSFFILHNCDNLDNWNNATLTDDFSGVKKTNCINLNTDSSYTYIDLQETKYWLKLQKIGFFMKSNQNYATVEIGITKDLNNISWNKFVIKTSGVWEYFNIPRQDGFRYIVFKNTDTNNTSWQVDSVQLLYKNKKQFSENISTVKYKFDSKGISCNVTCGKVIDLMNDDLFQIKKKLKIT